MKMRIWFLNIVLNECLFQVYREIKVDNFNPSLYKTLQIFYTSKDGTKIPMFIVMKEVALTFFMLIVFLNYVLKEFKIVFKD